MAAIIVTPCPISHKGPIMNTQRYELPDTWRKQPTRRRYHLFAQMLKRFQPEPGNNDMESWPVEKQAAAAQWMKVVCAPNPTAELISHIREVKALLREVQLAVEAEEQGQQG